MLTLTVSVKYLGNWMLSNLLIVHILLMNMGRWTSVPCEGGKKIIKEKMEIRSHHRRNLIKGTSFVVFHASDGCHRGPVLNVGLVVFPCCRGHHDILGPNFQHLLSIDGSLSESTYFFINY